MILTEEDEDIFTLVNDDKAMKVVLDLDLDQLIETYNLCVDKLSEKGFLNKKVS